MASNLISRSARKTDHSFGQELRKYLYPNTNLSLRELAKSTLSNYQFPDTILSKMCKGERLGGEGARERIRGILVYLIKNNFIKSIDQANSLLLSTDKQGKLRIENVNDAKIIQLILSIGSPKHKLTNLDDLIGNQEEQIDQNKKLVEIIWYLISSGGLNSGEKVNIGELREIRNKKTSDEMALFVYQGMQARDKGDVIQANKYFESVDESEIDDPEKLADVKLRKGIYLRTILQYEESMKLLEQSLKLFYSLGNSNKAAEVLIAIGDVYFYRKLYELAVRTYTQSAELLTRVEESSPTYLWIESIYYEARYALGRAKVKLKEYAEVEPLLLEAIAFFDRVGNFRNLSICYQIEGSYYKSIQEFEKARRSVFESFVISSCLYKNPVRTGLILFEIAELEYLAGNDEKASLFTIEFFREFVCNFPSVIPGNVAINSVLSKVTDLVDDGEKEIAQKLAIDMWKWWIREKANELLDLAINEREIDDFLLRLFETLGISSLNAFSNQNPQ